jgi:hypothetical protein
MGDARLAGAESRLENSATAQYEWTIPLSVSVGLSACRDSGDQTSNSRGLGSPGIEARAKHKCGVRLKDGVWTRETIMYGDYYYSGAIHH